MIPSLSKLLIKDYSDSDSTDYSDSSESDSTEEVIGNIELKRKSMEDAKQSRSIKSNPQNVTFGFPVIGVSSKGQAKKLPSNFPVAPIVQPKVSYKRSASPQEITTDFQRWWTKINEHFKFLYYMYIFLVERLKSLILWK